MKRKPCFIEDCGTCTLRAKSVLCDLAGGDLAAFQKIKRSLQYESRQTVFYEGHFCLGLYLLCAGRVKLTRSSARGQRRIVRILEAGEVIEKHAFGEKAIHEVTCETIEPSQICVIEKEPYLALIRRNGDLALKVIQLLSNELDMHMDQLDEFTFKTARQRLAGLLLDMSGQFGRKTGEGSLVVPTLKREEVAEIAGVTIETVIRLLGALRDEGLVRIDGRTITLLNPDRLARIARH